MMIVRPAGERGRTLLDWLDSRHTFSFDQYYDPRHMGFRSLRVINDDRVKAGAGFPTHGHWDMEIITYVLEGALEHKDSTGAGSVIGPGEVQRMTAGTGIRHSEYNHSQTEPVRFLQIWIRPRGKGLPPEYEQRSFSPEEVENRLRLIASPDGREASLTVYQDVELFACRLDPGETVRHALGPTRAAWLQVATGEVIVNGTELGEGDGVQIVHEPQVQIQARQPSHFLLFDLG